MRAEESQELFGQYERGDECVEQYGRNKPAADHGRDAGAHQRRRKGGRYRVGARVRADLVEIHAVV